MADVRVKAGLPDGLNVLVLAERGIGCSSRLCQEDYRSDMERAIRETRHLIQEALGYIKRQEDGPVTMRYAITDIDKAVDDIIQGVVSERRVGTLARWRRKRCNSGTKRSASATS